MKIAELLTKLNEIAPFSTAEEWDNVGLLIGNPNQSVETVLLAVDCTNQTLQFAKEQSADLILVHHPLIFHPIKQLVAKDMPYQLIESGISLIACHTNWDKAEGGVDDTLARIAGLEDFSILDAEGFGRIGAPRFSETVEELGLRIKTKIPASPLRIYGNSNRQVNRLVTLCGCGEHDVEEAIAQGADCIVTGEMRSSYVIEALRADLSVITLGHDESERLGMVKLQSILATAFPDVLFIMDDSDYPLMTL